MKTGLGPQLAQELLRLSGLGSPFGLLVLGCLATVVLTNFISNTAAISILAPILYPMAVQLGADPRPTLVAAALSSSLAFLLPVSTPPNAIAYGTGLIRVGQMVRRGAILNVLAVAALLGYFWLVT